MVDQVAMVMMVDEGSGDSAVDVDDGVCGIGDWCCFCWFIVLVVCC